MKHGFVFPSITEEKTWRFASQRYLLEIAVEKTPADVGLPLSSLSSPSTLQRKPVPSVCHTAISISALRRFFGSLVSLTHYFLGSAYLSGSVQRNKKNEKVMSELIRAVLF